MGKVKNPVVVIVAAFREEDKAAEVLAGLKDIAELMGPKLGHHCGDRALLGRAASLCPVERRGGDHSAGVEGRGGLYHRHGYGIGGGC
jgi:hypothetical protein